MTIQAADSQRFAATMGSELAASAFMKFARATGIGAYRKDIPLDVYQFARAVLVHDPQADVCRDEIVRRRGPLAFLALAFAFTEHIGTLAIIAAPPAE